MICGRSTYRYYISWSGAWLEIFLTRELKIKHEREKGMAYLRRKVDTVKFLRWQNPGAYLIFSNRITDICDNAIEIKFRISRTNRSGITDDNYWLGYINLTDIKYNDTLGIVEFNPRPDDDYRWIDDNKDIKYDLLKSEITDRPFKWVETSHTVVIEYNTVNSPTSPYCYWEYIYLATEPADWNDVVHFPATFAPGNYYRFKQQRLYVNPDDTTWLPVISGENGEQYWTDTTSAQLTNQDVESSRGSGNKAKLMIDILEYLFNTAPSNPSGFTISGDMLTNATNPITSDNPNPIRYEMFIYTKYLKGTNDYDTVCEITLDEVMDYLESKNIYYYIDSGNIYFKHISEVPFSADIDLTDTATYLPKYQVLQDINGDQTDNEFEYDNDLPIKEIFEWAAGYDKDGYISYSNILADPAKENNKKYGRFMGDFAQAINNKDELPDDAYLVISTYLDSGTYYIITEDTYINDTLYVGLPNGCNNWWNILNAYHKHNRPFKAGTIDGVATDFLSLRRIKKQKELRFPQLETLDNTKLITTNLGDGEIDSAEQDLDTDFINVELIYEACTI